MFVRYLFNSKGEWIAFRMERNVFDTDGKWIGWLPSESKDVVTSDGHYLGTITDKNRLYHFKNYPVHAYPRFQGCSAYPGCPDYPGAVGHSPLPSRAEDVVLSEKK